MRWLFVLAAGCFHVRAQVGVVDDVAGTGVEVSVLAGGCFSIGDGDRYAIAAVAGDAFPLDRGAAGHAFAADFIALPELHGPIAWRAGVRGDVFDNGPRLVAGEAAALYVLTDSRSEMHWPAGGIPIKLRTTIAAGLAGRVGASWFGGSLQPGGSVDVTFDVASVWP